ncbi:TlyA family RNA methyltransferase [Mycoplasmatota bacterium]|nr:TlyA family RNA methyltransferase [Mycoplasmatota bacterium]
MNKERIDVLLVERGFFETREKAKRNIMAGLVFVNNEKIDKPGEKVDVTKEIIVKGNVCPYVSRGGYKLEKALQAFDIDIKNKIMLDIGASTGGFTDCALQNGVKLVYAVDVGYNQLDWKMRSHKQVISIERCNFRYATTELFTKGLPEFASIDVSFISLRLILPVLKTILVENGEVVALIKPQFEAGKALVGKKGIVRDKSVHLAVINEIIDFCELIHFEVLNLTFSPIKGTEGNIEFLLHLKNNETLEKNKINIEKVVNLAHELK